MIYQNRICRTALLGMALLGSSCAADAPSVASKSDTPAPAIDYIPSAGGISNVGGASMSLIKTDTAVFNQRDPEWGTQTLGSTSDLLGDYGCTLTSVAMAANNLGYETDPGRLNAAMSANGGFTDRGWFVWGALDAATDGTIVAEYYDEPKHADIDACLVDRGGYPLVKFMLFGQVQHWALIVGKSDETYLIRDPLHTTRNPSRLQTRAPSILSVRCIREK